jgi:hypothetical protein
MNPTVVRTRGKSRFPFIWLCSLLYALSAIRPSFAPAINIFRSSAQRDQEEIGL